MLLAGNVVSDRPAWPVAAFLLPVTATLPGGNDHAVSILDMHGPELSCQPAGGPGQAKASVVRSKESCWLRGPAQELDAALGHRDLLAYGCISTGQGQTRCY